MYYFLLCHYDHILTKTKEERCILPHSLGGSSSWSVDPTAFGAVVRQHIMVTCAGSS
jgi:hypothetical protein